MLKALTNFACHITDETGLQHLLEFHEGEMIWDEKIERHILSLGCPVVTMADKATRFCSKCRTMFDSLQHPHDAVVSPVNATIQVEGHTFTYRAGEIVEHRPIQKALDVAGFPLETVTAIQCPRCGNVFR